MEKLTLNEVKEVQLDILDVVDKFCENNQLIYFLGFGTLLGSVRHEGYIPWDDDIDILMPRDDYERFIQLFHVTNYDVKSHYKDEMYPYPFAKVSYEKTKLIENVGLQYDIGVNIDVFPLDTFLEDERLLRNIHKKFKFYNWLLSVKKISIDSQRKLYKNLIIKTAKTLLKPIHYKKIVNKIDKNALLHKNKLNTYMMGCMVNNYSLEDIMKSSIFLEQTILSFEGREYFAPQDYDSYLKNIYGDYMKLPPKDERETHHDYEAFWL